MGIDLCLQPLVLGFLDIYLGLEILFIQLFRSCPALN